MMMNDPKTLTYSSQARDTYFRAVQARATIVDQLIDVRRDARALEASGVTRDEARQAFETVWKVANFYETLLLDEAEVESKVNDQVTESLLPHTGEPAPVPATDALEVGDCS